MKPLQPDAYLSFAAERNMTITSPIPASSLAKVKWRCNLCGREYSRSLKEMRKIPHCRCAGKRSTPKSLYDILGEELGIQLSGSVPLRTTDDAIWKGYNGELFTAPYAALSRPVIPRRYRGYLSPTYEPESSNYNKTALMLRLQRSRELLSGK